MKTASECRTLAEYRLDVLGMRQKDVGMLARCRQAWVSKVEAGHLPAPWRRQPIADAYRLSESEFVRLVRASRAAVALRTPFATELPLFATATSSACSVSVVRLQVEYGSGANDSSERRETKKQATG